MDKKCADMVVLKRTFQCNSFDPLEGRHERQCTAGYLSGVRASEEPFFDPPERNQVAC